MANAPTCPVCGGRSFTDRPVVSDSLVQSWQLSAQERAYVDRQQGTTCGACGANLRSGALAAALLAAAGSRATLREFVSSRAGMQLELLEVNEAGTLSPLLSLLPRRRLARFPDVDMQALPYPEGTFDIVIHSDTLEHVPDPIVGLAECRRVLRPSGAVCFTVPVIVGRLSRDCAGREPSYHGDGREDMRVHTEFGADVWAWPLRAGFGSVTVTAIEYPSALALTAWKTRPCAIGSSDGVLPRIRRLFQQR